MITDAEPEQTVVGDAVDVVGFGGAVQTILIHCIESVGCTITTNGEKLLATVVVIESVVKFVYVGL